MADVFRLRGEPDQAIRLLEKSLKLNGPGIATQFNLGMSYKDLKKFEKAIKAFKKSLEINPALNEAHYQIAQIKLVQKNQDSALKSIESAIKSDPSNLEYQEFRDKISDS
ncbi:uncharacterized protein METZ01_LOCUS445784 [marine metagenome]|uniref:Uncharacterized protein n=1 Tax=marine metagenome TaxID=408172 RepID=A0A382ZCD2_9ZZZZ